MSEWVQLCGVSDAPNEGAVMEIECAGKTVCLARVGGELRAVDNVCPHREGPLGQGWVEGGSVVCPWHSWAFDLATGAAEYPAGERVSVYALRTVNADVQIEI